MVKEKIPLILIALFLGACQTVKNNPVEVAERDCPVQFDDSNYYKKTDSFCQSGLYSDNSGKWYNVDWSFENNSLHWGEIELLTLPSFHYWINNTMYTAEVVQSWNQFKGEKITGVQSVSCDPTYTCFSFQHPTKNVSCVYFGRNDSRGLPGTHAGGNNRFQGYFCSTKLTPGNVLAETSRFIASIYYK